MSRIIVFVPILLLLFFMLAITFITAGYEIEYFYHKNLQVLQQKVAIERNNGVRISYSKEFITADGENRIEIPQIGVRMPILKGNHDVMNQGAWLRDTGVIPDSMGNIIITAHRFLFLPPSSKTFFHLDKLQVGSEIHIIWEHRLYTFLVSAVTIKEASDVFIEYPSVTKKLTLYTCTPLWSAEKRLVVISYPK